MADSMACEHETCQKLSRLGVKGVVALMYKNLYGNRVFMLGKEFKGKNKKLYNVCCGKMKKYDNGCYINAMCRKLREEYCMGPLVNDYEWFNELFMQRGRIVFRLFDRTAVFNGYFPKLDTVRIRSDIETCRENNTDMDQEVKLMDDVDWFHYDIDTLNRDDVSVFAKSVLKRMNNM